MGDSSIVCVAVDDYVSEGGREVINEESGEIESTVPEADNNIGSASTGTSKGLGEAASESFIDSEDEDGYDDARNDDGNDDDNDEVDDPRKDASLYSTSGGKLNNNKRLTKKKKYKGGVCIKQIDPRLLSKDLQDKIKLELGIETIGGKTKKCYKRIKNKRKTIRK